nr:MAG TPA: hypothetical protein [Bacteriophage sp.]
MKKFLSIVSVVSFYTTMTVLCSFSLYVGALVTRWIEDELSIKGAWCLAFLPLVCVIGGAVSWFVLLGLYKYPFKK